jgi:pimeloyl-ACP methyl ester carboxylesterase
VPPSASGAAGESERVERVVREWESRGGVVDVDGRSVWVLDAPARNGERDEPLLVLHGFPSCSFDWRHVLDALREHRRVVAPDFLGFGLSDKPDLRYSMRMQADVVEGVARQFGLSSVALLTHDMGDTVGGELLARSLEGTLPFEVTRRVLTNGSIYINMAHLTDGQQLLLSLDDAPSQLITGDGFKGGLALTFSKHSNVSDDELEAQWLLASRRDGHTLLPRTIRYVEDRRKEERRYTGAIETHASPVGVVWGADDPVAVVAMTQTFNGARPNAPITILENVGHYPMVESPTRTAEAITAYL